MRAALPGFELDVQRSQLLRDGQAVDLEPKVFDLLLYLIEHPHRLIGKQELKREVWKAQRLSDGVTANAIAKLRRALGQSAEASVPIETVRGRGYIFHLPQAAQPSLVEAEKSAPEPSQREPLDPFVGRTTTLDDLATKLERARHGAAGLVLLCGPAGIGKTRVVKEFVRRARLSGTPAWLGAAYDGEGFPAYWPWMQVVREAQRSDPSAFARALPNDSLLSHWASLAGPPSVNGRPPDPQEVRFRLFDELTRCLGSLCADGPKMIVLDDLQWADAGSIDLLGHVVRALDSSPVLFLATLRDEEPVSRSVDDALSKLGRVATRVRITGLTEQESRLLAHELRSEDPPSEVQLRALFQRSEGNPFFIRQFLEWWTEAGANLARSDELPPGARDVIRRRLALLPSQARRVLAAASVFGARFRASRLGEVLEESADTILESLSVASSLSVVTCLSGTDEFAFTHALLQETLYQDTDLQTRGALHSRIADSFGSGPASTTTAEHLGERARHLVHALPSRLEEAVHACESAAQAAQRSAGFERASDLLVLAIKKLEIEGSAPDEEARLWIELGDNLFFAAALDPAWNAYRRAAELLRSVGSSERLARLAPLLVRCVNLGSGDVEFARTVVDEVLRTLPPEALRERSCTLAQKAQLAWQLSTAERTAMLDEAGCCLDDSQVRLEVAYARTMLRDPNTLPSNAQAATALLALTEAQHQEPNALRYRTLHRLGAHVTQYVCAAIECDLVRATEAEAAIVSLARTSHMRACEVIATLIRAGRALAEGRLDNLAAILSGSAATSSDTSTVFDAMRSYQLQLAEARGALPFLEKLELPPPPERTTATPRQRTDTAIMHAYLYARTGRHERAREVLGRVPHEDIERMPVLYGDLGVLTGLAQIYLELGDEAGMQHTYEKLCPFAGRNALMPTFAYRGAVDHFLGMLAHTRGDSRRAREHLRRAVEINRRLGMPRQTSESEALLVTLG